MAESSKYTYDEWVGQVRPDPRNTDPLTLLQGYIGQSSESGHIRVYSDATLNNFVEVPEDAILYAQQLSQTESSLGGSRLWLRSDAVIIYGDPRLANRPKSTFLEGDLMQQYTTQYGGYDPTGGIGPFGGPVNSTNAHCTSRQIMCTGQVVTQAPNCQTQLNQCPPVATGPFICLTLLIHCLPHATVGTNCRSQLIHCPEQASAGPNCKSQQCPGNTIAGPNCNTHPIACQPQITTTTTYTMGGYYGTFNPYMM